MESSTEELLTQGRRDLLCGEISKAVENLQKVCESLAAVHGDFHESLATPNLLYGTALLELARMESTVIGNALDGIPEQEDDSDDNDDELIEKGPELTNEEKEDISNQVIDALCTEPEDVKENGDEASDEKTEENEDNSENEENGDDDDNVDEEGDENECVNEENNENKNEENGNNEGEKEPADNCSNQSEDVTNLQIAWEVIEVAKKIFSLKDDDESKLNVAECLEKLGEISREKEDYEQAITDLKESASIRLQVLGKSERRVAESYFQLGTTYAVSGDLSEASSSFRSSLECLKLYADDIRNKLQSVNDDEKISLESTLTEVEGLVVEVERRVADIEEDRLSESVVPTDTPKETSVNGCSSKTNDITHLIKRKRTIEPVAAIDPTLTKEKEVDHCDDIAIKKKRLSGELTTNGVH